MSKSYSIGQLRGAFAAGKVAGQSEGKSPVAPAPQVSRLSAHIEDQLFKMVETHGPTAFLDQSRIDHVKALIAMLWQGGRGNIDLCDMEDRIEDRLDAYCDEKYGANTWQSDQASMMLVRGLGDRIWEVKDGPRLIR